MSLHAETKYRWLDRFISGGFGYSRLQQLDASAHSTRINWQHQQSFSSRTRFNASIDYATSAQVIQTNTVNPFLATASLASQVNFDKRFDWGTLTIGGSRSQDLSNDLITQNFPQVSLTPSPVNITPSITWSPGFSFTNQQTLHSADTRLLVPGASGVPDTLALFADSRQTAISFQTPVRVGSWNWSNTFQVNDARSSARQEFVIPDPTAPGGQRRVLFDRTFQTTVDWQTGINLPSLFTGTWKLQPGIAIVNQTSAGPFMIKNQFTNGQFVRQGKRLQFSAGLSPTFFGFFPGIGPLARIRHALSPIVSYQYAPGSKVSDEFAHVLGHFRNECHRFSRSRMRDGQPGGVQCLARKRCDCFLDSLVGNAAPLRTGVERIADDRMAEVFHVDADLMGASGAETNANERCVAKLLFDRVFSDR